MAETKEKKGFNAALYAVVAGIVVAVALVLITIFAFTTRYTGFSNEKVAQAYVDTIVQTGDGYNAYKNTLVSKNQKFGKFVTALISSEQSSFLNAPTISDLGVFFLSVSLRPNLSALASPEAATGVILSLYSLT